ncbi:MAG: hypothetical protein WAT81_04785 [Candidatus Moraniibacteriota bacterium]
MKWFLIAIAVLGVTALVWPVCVVLSTDSLKEFSPSIEKRISERGMIWKIWQFKDGDWYQCKSRLERFGFN